MKRLLMPLMAVCVAIAGAAPVVNDFAIIIDGKTKNVELRPGGSLIKSSAFGLHSSTGVYASGGPFSGDGAGGRIIARGKCTLPPNSSISAFRNASLDFVTGVIFKNESSIKRNSKLVIKTDELRKDGTYVAVIEQTMLGYHH